MGQVRGLSWSRKRGDGEAIKEATGRAGIVSTRFTHVYPDGPAPYYTFNAYGTPGRLIEQWRHIKSRASDAVLAAGGTITHHHAVGRDHMPWYRKQRPVLFGRALEAAKSVLDPAGILNPGVSAVSLTDQQLASDRGPCLGDRSPQGWLTAAFLRPRI